MCGLLGGSGLFNCRFVGLMGRVKDCIFDLLLFFFNGVDFLELYVDGGVFILKWLMIVIVLVLWFCVWS